MTTALEFVHVLGVDPGTTTGYAWLLARRPEDPASFEGPYVPTRTPTFVTSGEWAGVDDMELALQNWHHSNPGAPLVVGAESFIVGSNQHHGRGQSSLRDPLMVLDHLHRALHKLMTLGDHEVFVVRRSASTVKQWGTQRRLERAFPRSLAKVHGPHAKDALRHALYAAVRVGYSIDPLMLHRT